MTAFTDYLAAKKSVDDRALNAHVWQTMTSAVTALPAPRILELGAGIGTMVERLLASGLVGEGHIHALDNQAANIAAARKRLATSAESEAISFEAVDLHDFAARSAEIGQWDVVVAHALLDLLDIEDALPRILALLRPSGYFYFTINFDGATIFQPTIDPALDAQIEALYHRTMDERVTDGRVSGDSQSGRHLFGHLRRAGATVLAAGSSDWVVFAGAEGYPAEEAAFLRFIVATVEGALTGHPDLDAEAFAAWVAQRQRQIDSGELVYIAHQIDFFGQV